jgi:hypothetical protein
MIPDRTTGLKTDGIDKFFETRNIKITIGAKTVSLTFYLYDGDKIILDLDISHNCGSMAEEVRCYHALWHPEKHWIIKAKQLIPILQKSIEEIGKRDDSYYTLEKFITKIFIACIKNPEAEVKASR